MRRIAIIIATLMLFPGLSVLSFADEYNGAGYDRTQYLGLDLPDEVLRRFEILNALPEPVLLNTDDVFDWREMGGVTPVKDQRQCGSCWVFSGVGAFESAIKIADSIEWDLSEQQIIDCNYMGRGCDGGWVDLVFNHYSNNPAVEEECYPYMAQDWFPCEQDTCVGVTTLDGYTGIAGNVNAMKNAILEGPISSCFTVCGSFQSTPDCYEYPNPGSTNHAIVLVGWDDNMCDGGAWIMKNSWGAGWNGDGYCYIGYNDLNIGTANLRPIYESRAAVLNYDPSEFTFNVNQHTQSDETLTIANLGTGELWYRLRYNQAPFQDEFGYLFFDSENSQGPEYEWIDITSTGEVIDFPGSPANSNSGPIDLGFDFNFYGNEYNSICVCSNGWASFSDGSSTSSYNREIPCENAPNDLLAAFWANLDITISGDVYFYTNETDQAVISWNNVSDNWGEGTFTFQIVLIAPDTIIYNYNSMGPEGRIDRATIGIENSTGTVGLQVCRNELYTYGEKSVRFTLGNAPGDFDWLTLDHLQGFLYPDDNREIIVACDAGDHEPGTYYGEIDLYNNDPDQKHVNILVNMNVGVTSVADNENIPLRTELSQNYPNPFNASTEIAYTLSRDSKVRLEVYNILGQRIKTLVDTRQEAGCKTVNWDASDYSSGIYFYKLTVNGKTFTKRMTLLK